ncbi:MAG: response regulator [Melioribacteraceae bacterium]|nr:response regulator [Melioribacteraceae bacterium]
MKTLLIIEDEEMIVDIFSLVLRNHFNILRAKDGEEVTEVIRNNSIDVFIVDISLKSEKDGIQIIKELRATEKYSLTPIIVITAHAFKKDEISAMQAGATRFLRKPVENEKLLSELLRYE